MPSLFNNDPLSTDELRMDAANWLRLQELYHLLEATPAEQQTAVLEAHTDDPALRARVLSLLATSSAPEPPAPAAYLPTAAGSRVGPYAIVRHLGSGGLGSVYLIERLIGGAIQPCALKLLAMRSTDASFHARFEREQQILATLQHANITHLLDAGISEMGQPYLVMEFVDGVDLTSYCDERCLGLRQRLELFLEICEAVTYAHSKLVVHLDLKPSNVMVTSGGKVKLLDFGTSKLIEADSAMTTTVLATPAYASPEQLRGEPITTSCDLYSLGAILYELLTGHRPFGTGSAATAIHRAATEEEPVRLTTRVSREAAEQRGMPVERLKRLLQGDLSSIVARCLRSRPRDRYSSVEALAEDLRRYLGGRPVLARRQTTTYRMSKFLRRNRMALSFGSVVLLLLVTAGVYSYLRQQQALRQGRRAQQMQAFLSQVILLANERKTGKPAATLPEFLDLGIKVLPQIIKDPDDRRTAQLSLGESLYDSREFARALPVFQEVAASAQASNDAQSEAEANAFGGLCAFSLGQTQLADTLTERGLMLAQGRSIQASTHIWAEGAWGLTHATRGIDPVRSKTLLQAAVDESRASEIPERERVWMLEKLGLIEQATGDLAPASKLADEAYDLVRDQPYAVCDRAVILQFKGNVFALRGDDLGSLPVYRQAIEWASACSGADSGYTLSLDSLLARAMTNVGQSDKAIEMLQAALPLWRKAGDSLGLSVALVFLARAFEVSGHPDQAELYARQAISEQQGKVSENSTRMAMPHLIIAQSLSDRKRYASALAEAEVTNGIYDRIKGMSAMEELYHAQARALLRMLQERSFYDAASPQRLPDAK